MALLDLETLVAIYLDGDHNKILAISVNERNLAITFQRKNVPVTFHCKLTKEIRAKLDDKGYL